MEGRLMYRELVEGRSFFMYYKDGTLLRALWFLSAEEIKSKKFTVCCTGISRIRFVTRTMMVSYIVSLRSLI